MLPSEVLAFWNTCAGFDAQLERIGQSGLAGAEDRFRRLCSIQQADAVRKELSAASRSDNAVLAIHLINEALTQAHEAALAETTLALLDWAQLASRYATDHERLGTHASFLKGHFAHLAGRFAEAMRAYDESLDAGKALDDRRRLQSICHFCLAKLHADCGHIERAIAEFEQSLGLVDETFPNPADWRSLITAQRERCVKQARVAEDLIQAGTQNEVAALLAEHAELVDRNLHEVIKSRSRRAAVAGKHDEARTAAALFDRIAPPREDKDPFRVELAKYYLSANAFAPAEDILTRLLADMPEDADLQYMLAVSLQGQEGRQDRCIEILTALLKSHPDHAPGHAMLGGYHVVRQEWPQARVHLSEALRLDPDNAIARHFMRCVPTTGIQFDPATKTVTVSSDFASYAPEEMAEAISAAMVAAQPDKAEVLLRSFAADKGEEFARRVAARAGLPVELSHFEKAERLFGARQLVEAIEEYSLAIEENGDHAPAYMGLGDCYYHQGKFHLAAAYFEESVAISPSASTYRFLGNAYERVDRMNEAIDAYRQAVAVDPTYEPAKAQLQMALRRRDGA